MEWNYSIAWWNGSFGWVGMALEQDLQTFRQGQSTKQSNSTYKPYYTEQQHLEGIVGKHWT